MMLQQYTTFLFYGEFQCLTSKYECVFNNTLLQRIDEENNCFVRGKCCAFFYQYYTQRKADLSNTMHTGDPIKTMTQRPWWVQEQDYGQFVWYLLYCIELKCNIRYFIKAARLSPNCYWHIIFQILRTLPAILYNVNLVNHILFLKENKFHVLSCSSQMSTTKYFFTYFI